MKSTDKFVLVLVASLFLLLAGCGGGGSSSSDEMMPTDGDGMAMDECPEGQTRNEAGECVASPPPGPTQAEIDAEAQLLAAAIGLDEDGDPVSVSPGLPNGATVTNGKVGTGTEDNSFKASDAAVASIIGWTSDSTTRTVRNVKDDIVLYSNIEAPTAQRYATFFTDGTTSGLGTIFSSSSVGDGESGEVVLNPSGFDAGDHADRFMGARFPSGSNQIRDFTDDEDTDAKENEVAGSFFGVPGTFACTGDSCTARTNADGDLSAFTGAWTFTPTRFTLGADAAPTADPPTPATGTMVQGVVPDPDYMVFGYWLQTTTNSDGTTELQFQPHAQGALAYGGTDSPVTGTPQGTATYEGPATGLYIKKTLTTDGGTVTAGSPFSSGQFTASAMLTAHFGGTSVAAINVNTISGTISDFKDGDSSINENWTLKLNKSLIDTTGAWVLGAAGGAATNTEQSHGTTSGNNQHSGAWTASFYGASPEDPESTGNDIPPGSVAGTFNGHFQDGHVAGAFGASRPQ